MVDTMPRIASDSDFFDSMLNLIPVTYYYPNQETSTSKFQHNKKSATGALLTHKGKGKKRGAKQEEENPAKNPRTTEEKQSQFDPANYKTVLDVQRANLQSKDNLPAKAAKGGKFKKNAPKDTKPAKKQNQTAKQEQPASTAKAASSMDDLRKRLHDKITQLRQGRKQDPTKLELKQKALAKKKQARKEKKLTKAPKAEITEEETKEDKLQVMDESEDDASPTLDFTFAPLKKEEKTSKYKRRRGDTNQKALNKLDHYNDYIAKLEVEDPEKAKEVKQQRAYKASILRAQGVTVKDDRKMLKNAIKKSERKSKKSQKEWKERTKEVNGTMKEKQIKRTENLKARNKGKKKKGRPGFEGSTAFLN